MSAALFVIVDGPERALAQRLDAAEEQGRRLEAPPPAVLRGQIRASLKGRAAVAVRAKLQ